MDAGNELSGHYVRIVALISLMLGLNDAARLLGVSHGDVSPIETLGTTGFVYLAAFSLARLFAAVGLWIQASWGAVVLIAATSVELGLFLTGSPDVQMSSLGFGVRTVLLLSIIVILALGLRLQRAHAQD